MALRQTRAGLRRRTRFVGSIRCSSWRRRRAHLAARQLHRGELERGVGELETLARVVVGNGSVVVVTQEVQVTHDGAAGHCQLTREMAAVGQGAGAGAFTNQLQDALQPVVLGAGGGFQVFGPVPLDGT
jgi:hypothetical protein